MVPCLAALHMQTYKGVKRVPCQAGACQLSLDAEVLWPQGLSATIPARTSTM